MTPANTDAPDAVVGAILAAMVRVLAGRPTTSAPGDMTITAVATEANVKRHLLTHRHTGLKDLFYELRDGAGNPVVAQAQEAKSERDELAKRLGAARDEARKWKNTAHTLARVVHTLTIENDALRSGSGSNVRSIK